MYKITDQELQFLKELFGKDRVHTGEEINEDFAHDEMPEYGKFFPSVVVDALCTEEVSRLLAYANENKIPVTVRGAGTGLCGGCVATCGGILLNLLNMNKILEIDEKNLIAVVEPGVLLMELAEKVEEQGLLYPPDPGEKSATIGGNVMTNAGGMRAIKYGVTREYVRGMEVVLANGEVQQLGGKIAKTSSGYSLKDLLIGSEGTLGVVTKIQLKLIKLPKRFITLLVPFNSLEDCLNTVPVILNASDTPLNLEFMEREVILKSEEYLGTRFPDKSAQAYLMISYSGNSREEIENCYDGVAQACLAHAALDVLISDTEERQSSIWTARGAFLEAIKSSTSSMDECDIVVPIEKVAEYLQFAKQLSLDEAIRIPSFGHAGDGNLHLYVCRDEYPEDIWKEKCKRVMDQLYECAKKLKGEVSGEHGIGHAKREYLLQSVGGTQMRLMREIKRIFDPNNILNPGKLIL